MEKAFQNRLVERTAFSQPVRFEMSIMEAGRINNIKCDGQGVDISPNGLGMISACSFYKGEILKLSLPVNIVKTTMPVFAEIMWSRIENESCRVGLKFLM